MWFWGPIQSVRGRDRGHQVGGPSKFAQIPWGWCELTSSFYSLGLELSVRVQSSPVVKLLQLSMLASAPKTSGRSNHKIQPTHHHSHPYWRWKRFQPSSTNPYSFTRGRCGRFAKAVADASPRSIQHPSPMLNTTKERQSYARFFFSCSFCKSVLSTNIYHVLFVLFQSAFLPCFRRGLSWCAYKCIVWLQRVSSSASSPPIRHGATKRVSQELNGTWPERSLGKDPIGHRRIDGNSITKLLRSRIFLWASRSCMT